MSALSSKHLLGIKDISKKDIQLIFKTAENFKEVINRPIKKVPSLRDITIANIFFENSTRTKISFELAEKRLSADIVNFNSGTSSVNKGETLIDTVNNILAMKVDMVVMRHPAPGAAKFLSKHIDANIINAGDGTHEHPTQALLDAYTLTEKLGNLSRKNILIVGDIIHSRVALSNIHCLQKLGANVRVCGPPNLIPNHIESLGVEVSYDLKETEFEIYTPGFIRLLEKSVLLNQIDVAWKNHLEKMDILRDSIGWRSYGQFDPLLEYKNESFNLFVDTTREIKYNAVYNILKSRFL